MGDIIAITCPHCGGQVQRINNEYFAKCPYCGVEVAFNEIKEEVQLGAYRERIGALEQDENTDREKRLKMQKWIRIRNIVFAAMGFLNFLAFLFVGYDTMAGIDSWVGLGALLFLIAWVTFFTAVPVFGLNYPGYNALYKREEKIGKLTIFFKLGAAGLGIMFATAILAYIVLSIAVGR